MKQLTLFVAMLTLAVSAVAQDYKTVKIYSESPSYAISFLNNAGDVGGYYTGTGTWHAFRWTKAHKFQDLSTLGGMQSETTGINDAGQVIGFSDLPNNNNSDAFLSSPGAGLLDLGTLGGTFSKPTALNNSGEVVGYSTLSGDLVYRAFLWTATSGIQDIGAPDGATPSAINASGQVVGNVEDNKGNGYMFFWSQTGGLQVLIPPQSINVYPQGLTDSGQVVGNFSSAECPNDGCGFIWTQTGGFSLVKINGTPGTAVRQNADGTVIAYVGAAPYTTLHAFSWTLNGGAVDLGMLPGMSISVPRSINSKGQILGVACAISGARCKDFVWSAGQGMRVIPKSSAFSNVYWAINDAGQILGLIDYAKTVVLTPWIHVKLESSQNPSKLGQSVTFTATASSVAGPPKDGERVTFRAGKKVLGSVRLVTGVATLTTSSLVIGTHAVTATYAGDANYDAQKSGALQQVVTP